MYTDGPSDIKLVPGKKRHVLVGGDILPDITCTSECNPPCKITWGKHGEGNKLSLGAVTTEDAGEYTCTATRDDGQAVEQTISVFVGKSFVLIYLFYILRVLIDIVNRI